MKNQRFRLYVSSCALALCGLLTFQPALAFSPCDFLSGDAGSLCRAAEQASKEKKRQKAQAQQEATSSAGAVTSPDGQPSKKKNSSKAVAQAPRSDVYRAEKFYGINVWADAFTKAVNDPPGFKTFMAGMSQSANSSNATVNALAMGPQRNHFQKFLTDHQAYVDVFRAPASLMEKAKQCTVPRDYSPAEACDCVAGFPGDTLIGPGAGELVTGSNSAIGIDACGKAAATATDPAQKARYTAQRARAQIYTMDTFQAVQWADEASSMGYRRAAIVKASAALRDFEVRNSGFPAPTQAQNKEIVDIGIKYLKAARAAGVRESYIVAQQFRQTLSIYKFNTAFYAPIFKSMTTPPPPEKAQGCRADGVPCQGERYDSSGNIVRN